MFGRLLPLPLLILQFLAAAASAQVPVTGTVVDPSGGAVAGATVSLQGASAKTDALGQFRIERVTPGRYRIDVAAGDAFKPLRRDVNITASMPPLVLQLSLATVQESVEVTGDEIRPTVDTAANLDTTTLSGASLDQLPVFDQDFVGALSQFLDPGSIATGGATIVVDGVEMKSAGVPKSAVQEISINDDPYTAESSRPGRGRIEIITKPGSGHLRGNVNFTFRNAALAARSYFAPTKPPEQRQSAEGVFSGPIGKEGTSFLVTFSRQIDAAAAVVHALTPAGAVDETVAAPSANTELMARVTHDWSEKHRGSLQVNWKRSSNLMQGAGGVVLPQAAVNASSREDDLFFTVHSILTPERLNQFQLTLEFNREPSISASAAPGIIVRDAFVGGGAQATVLRTESGGKLNDIVTISRGKHVVKFGVQIPNLNRRVWDDESNQGGTFSFATLADYAAGRPYAYTVQQGSGHVALWWREYGAFVQDQIRLGQNLQVSVGLRYDWQAFFHDANNFAPRASLAWSPRKDGKTIVRGGAGVFYDRTGVGPIANLMLHDGATLRSYTILNPSYPNPFVGVTPANVATNVTQLAPDVQIPYSLQYSVNLERQVAKSISVVAGYRASRGYHLFRSVDINAPLPPDYTSVPDSHYGHVQQIRSDGRLRSDALELTLRGRRGKKMSGQVQYTYSRANNNTGGINWYPSNQYAPIGAEWGAADFDVRHRLNLLGTLSAGRWGNLGVSGRFASALPYSETAGIDLFHTGMANARPTGVGRNSLRASSFSAVDLRWSHDVQLTEAKGDKGRELTLSVDAFNVFNHPNFAGYVGNVRSPFYLSPTTVFPGRRLQLSAEVKFGG